VASGIPHAPIGESADVVVVGAGIVGLAHAVAAVRRGLSVVVVDRDEHPRGASVRNFGHCYVSAQAGESLELAEAARTRWLELAAEAGFWISECGTLLVVRRPEELAVVDEFAAASARDAHVLEPDEVLARAPVSPTGLLGALWTPQDVRFDPREAVPAIVEWLRREHGVRFLWRTAALGVDTGTLLTSRCEIDADAVVLAVGHDLDWLLPELAEEVGMRRCRLHMLRVTPGEIHSIGPALTSGLALLRYGGFAECRSVAALRARLAEERPELLEAGVNLIVVQRPNGDLVVGDTHDYAVSPRPFRDERLDALLLEEAEALLACGPLRVRERWQGVYAHAPDRDVLVTSPAPGVHAVTVTTGIGMTIGFGLAERVLEELFDPTHVPT
jgi:FAD dependent oxidoreductase TIGR03364